MGVPPAIKRVMYLSVATRRMTKGELDDLLAGARIRNQQNGVTGLLIYDGGRFAQVLEGDPATVDRLLENIRKDPRHTDYVELSGGMVDTRYFTGWDMDFANLHAYDGEHPQVLRDYMAQRHITDRTAVYGALVRFIKDHNATRPHA